MAAMLHARNNKNVLHYCSWHATWLPCKTSIGNREVTTQKLKEVEVVL